MDGLDAAMVLGIAGYGPAILLFDHPHDGKALGRQQQSAGRHRYFVALPDTGQHGVLQSRDQPRSIAGGDHDTAVSLPDRCQHYETCAQNLLIEVSKNKLENLRMLRDSPIAREIRWRFP